MRTSLMLPSMVWENVFAALLKRATTELVTVDDERIVHALPTIKHLWSKVHKSS